MPREDLLNHHERAGKSASTESEKRVYAFRRSQKIAAVVCCSGAVIVCAIVVGPKNSVLLAVPLTTFVVVLSWWNRRHPGVAPSESWRRGSLGEEKTAAVLQRLSRRSFVVMHDVALARSHANIDHVVIGTTGIFVLDSKNWNGKAVLTRRRGWVYGVVLERSATSTIAERDWVALCLEDMIARWRVPVYTAWVMTGTRQDVTEIGEVDVISLDQLLDYIVTQPICVRRKDVAAMAARAQSMLRSA